MLRAAAPASDAAIALNLRLLGMIPISVYGQLIGSLIAPALIDEIIIHCHQPPASSVSPFGIPRLFISPLP
jgi:hypothetical protein